MQDTELYRQLLGLNGRGDTGTGASSGPTCMRTAAGSIHPVTSAIFDLLPDPRAEDSLPISRGRPSPTNGSNVIAPAKSCCN